MGDFEFACNLFEKFFTQTGIQNALDLIYISNVIDGGKWHQRMGEMAPINFLLAYRTMPIFFYSILSFFLLAPFNLTTAASNPVKVFILAGQSNMEGKGKVSLLEYQITQPETANLFDHLHKDGNWIEREDVWIKFLDRKGNLTVGYGSPGCIGPELEFGNTISEKYDEQTLVIKTAWGGKSLHLDFRPPSSGMPAQEVINEMLKRAKEKQPEIIMADIKAKVGYYYRAMLADVSGTLSNLKEYFPAYEGQGYEISGFVWFQGWNDMINPIATAEYAENMANFIRDVRKDLKVLKMAFVIGQLGVGGIEEESNTKKQAFKDAQAAPTKLPEFKGNVAVVKTNQYWDMTADAVFKKGWREHIEEWEKVGSDYPFHYLGSTITFSQMGRGFGDAMLALLGKK